MHCTNCGKCIDTDTLVKRHYGRKIPETVFCDGACRDTYLSATGHFACMSKTGKDARSKAVTLSNSVHPRHERKEQ